MIDGAAISSAVRIVLVLSCCLATGCACVKHAQTTQTVPAALPPATSSTMVEAPPAEVLPEPEAPPAAVEAPRTLETSVLPPAIQPVSPLEPAPIPRDVVPQAPAAAPPAIQVAPVIPPPKPPVAVAATPAPAPQASAKAAGAPVASAPAAAPLDLKSLETRLRQTRAIGMLTKLSLKNQVDDLLDAFRAYHKRKSATTLPELRRSYDMLLLKVLSLLQDSDPPLARDIVRSRSAIWGILADPRKFTESNLMAGATP